MSIIRADSIKNRVGDGAPDFPNGITVTGVTQSDTPLARSTASTIFYESDDETTVTTDTTITRSTFLVSQ